jgi:hypothetical protein
MKKLYILAIAMFVFIFWTQAFAAEPVPPAQSYTAPAYQLSNNDLDKTVSELKRQMASEAKKSRTAIEENKEVIKENTQTMNSFRGAVMALLKGFSVFKENKDDAIREEAKNLGNQGWKNTWIIAVISILGFMSLGGFFWYITRKNTAEINKNIADAGDRVIDHTSEKVLEASRLMKPFLLNKVPGKNGATHNVKVHPIQSDGIVYTLRITNGIPSGYYTDPTKVPRTPAKDLTHLKSTNAKILAKYFSGEFDEADNYLMRLQKAVVAFAIETGEIEEVL